MIWGGGRVEDPSRRRWGSVDGIVATGSGGEVKSLVGSVTNGTVRGVIDSCLHPAVIVAVIFGGGSCLYAAVVVGGADIFSISREIPASGTLSGR